MEEQSLMTQCIIRMLIFTYVVILYPKLAIIYVSVVQYGVLYFMLFPPVTAHRPGFSPAQSC